MGGRQSVTRRARAGTMLNIAAISHVIRALCPNTGMRAHRHQSPSQHTRIVLPGSIMPIAGASLPVVRGKGEWRHSCTVFAPLKRVTAMASSAFHSVHVWSDEAVTRRPLTPAITCVTSPSCARQRTLSKPVRMSSRETRPEALRPISV